MVLEQTRSRGITHVDVISCRRPSRRLARAAAFVVRTGCAASCCVIPRKVQRWRFQFWSIKIRNHSSMPPCQHVSHHSRVPVSGIIPACRHASMSHKIPASVESDTSGYKLSESLLSLTAAAAKAAAGHAALVWPGRCTLVWGVVVGRQAGAWGHGRDGCGSVGELCRRARHGGDGCNICRVQAHQRVS